MTRDLTKDYKPDWVPEGSAEGFTTNVMAGVTGGHDGIPGSDSHYNHPVVLTKRKKLDTKDYVSGLLNKERNILGQAITLIESNAQKHMVKAQELIREILPYAGKSIRIGITGVPGAGKSTFIEAFGSMLCEQGLKVAVLAVDPSSSITKGSILGDKTRMETLSRNELAFIRPSPSGGTLGGVGRKSRETIMLCEAAGYDVILVETVGVGQSEVTVKSLCDFFLLVVLTGAGDELQGMKKGVMELADGITVNKADGDNLRKAMIAKSDYERIVHYLRPATKGWKTQVKTCSSINGEGIPEIWEMIKEFEKNTKASGAFKERRTSQTFDWVNNMVQEHLQNLFENNPKVKVTKKEVEKHIIKGDMSATMAAIELINAFEGSSNIY